MPVADHVDVLASLLEVHRLRTVVAGRIDLTPPWRLDTEPADDSVDLISILIQCAGQTHLVMEPGTDPVVLQTGDVVVSFPRTNAYMHDGSDPAIATWRLAMPPRGVAAPIPLRLAAGEPQTSLVNCVLEIGGAPRGALLSGLPGVIHLSTHAMGESTQLQLITEAMIAESSAPGAASPRLMSRLAEALLILVLRIQAADLSSSPGLRALNDPMIAPVIGLMHADPGKPWSVASLAAACGLSRSAFAEHFSATVGQTPLAYLTSWRMATAARLLTTTNATVSSISEAVGYRSEAAFRHAFTAALHRSPREYRVVQRTAEAPALPGPSTA